MQTNTNTKQFVEINDIQDTLVLVKDGSLRSLVEVESVNFDLKSNDEQLGIIRGFQDFLNALDFPLQIVVSSRKLDITAYLKFVGETGEKNKNELLKMQIEEYARFIKGLAELANIMSKRFYIVVPYHAVEATQTQQQKGIRGIIKGFLASTKNATKLNEEDIAKYQVQIEQRIAVIMAGLNPLGMKTRRVDEKELYAIYYEYYNPSRKTS